MKIIAITFATLLLISFIACQKEEIDSEILAKTNIDTSNELENVNKKGPKFDCDCAMLSMSPLELIASGKVPGLSMANFDFMPPGWVDSQYWIQLGAYGTTGIPNSQLIEELLAHYDTSGDGNVTHVDFPSWLSALPAFTDLNGDGEINNDDNGTASQWMLLLAYVSGGQLNFNQNDIDCINRRCVKKIQGPLC